MAVACTNPSTDPEQTPSDPLGGGKLHDGNPDEPAKPGAKLPGDTLFSRDQVLEVHLTLSASDLISLEEHGNLELYKPGELRISGSGLEPVELGRVGVRHKGAWTLHHCWENPLGKRSHEGECAKLSYKLKFDEYDSEARLDGLKRLNLHASSNDDTRLHELMAYELFRDFGVDAPRTAVAKVFVNDEPQGLFIAVEELDGRYTKAHFPDGGGDGNLYKEIWPSADLEPGALRGALKTNEETGDVSAFIEFADAIAASSSSSFGQDLTPWLDIEHTLRYIAVDRAIKNWDGIMAFYSPRSPHNFYWYHDEGGSGRFQLIPWDLDNTFWDFDPFMAPQQWVTAPPVPDWNVEPSSCDPRPVWQADGGGSITPPRCDTLLDRLAENEWSLFEELGQELLAGPLESSRLLEKARRHSELLEPIIETDPHMSSLEWRMARARFEGTLANAVTDFQAFVSAGLRVEGQSSDFEPDPKVSEPGLDVLGVDDFELAPVSAGSLLAQVYEGASAGSETAAVLNLSAPIEGEQDLRFDFSFVRQPGTWDEWVSLGLATPGGVPVDVRTRSKLVLSLRADRSRTVRVRLDSPAYADTFGGAWSEFGMDVVVSTTAESFELPLAAFSYPEWAKAAWDAEQGWVTSDEAALAIVLSRISGLIFAPRPTFDVAGELMGEREDGFLQVDSIELR